MVSLPKSVRVFCLFIFILVACTLHVPIAYATITSCTGSVDMHSVPPSTTNLMNFSVTNDGPQNANWIKITVPANFTIAGSPYTPNNWTSSISDDKTNMIVTSTDTPLAQGNNYTFSVQVTSANVNAGSANWSIQLSDDGGSSKVDCGGDSRGVAIEGAISVPDPVISDIVVSGISDTQATISWNTDIPATSNLSYGTTTDYGLTSNDASFVTSHSRTITGLTANTEYHYDITSLRAEGNTADAGDNIFVTAAAGTTTTVTVTGTVSTTTTTVTHIVTPTPTPIDVSPPRVSVTTDFSKPFKVAPTIKGTATDLSGVASLEYSLDNGKSWLPVDIITTPGKSSTTFEFTPESLLDDNYIVKIQAADLKGNTGETPIGTLIVDRLPPRIGGNIATLGPQILAPSADGSYIVPAGLDMKLTLSAAGGPTSIDLSYLDHLSALQTISLKKNSDNGLWSGVLTFDRPGTYTISAHAIDGAGNRGERDVATVVVVPNGRISSSGEAVNTGQVTVYYLDSLMGQFVLWDGASYGQTNPQQLAHDGGYTEYLPAGTYYIDVAAPGYKSLVTSIFSLTDAAPITTNFALSRARAIRIGSWLIPLPDFRQTTASVTIGASTAQSIQSPLVGHEFPYFKLLSGDKSITSFDLRGKPTIITFVNTWMPDTTTQMAILNDVAKKKDINVLVIVPQETVSSVAIFKERGGYTMPIVSDPDGDLVDPLNLHSLPTHVFVDRKGTITAIQSGVFNKEELFDKIIQ